MARGTVGLARKFDVLKDVRPTYTLIACNSAYLLAAAGLGPLYGKLSDIIGEQALETLLQPLTVYFKAESPFYSSPLAYS